MSYFVTGATGFIGRFFVGKLLARGAPVYVLVRKGSTAKFKALRERHNANDKQLIAVTGDLSKKHLGVSDADIAKLKGKVKHVFHLAAIYDLTAGAEEQEKANIEGTRNAVQFAEKIGAGCFHHVSSIASAGMYDGVFREDMFDEADGLDHPYFRTKHDSEAVVRNECKRPYRIYRPGMVVGHSKTGEIDKIDGPYYVFKFIQKVREMLPMWMPVIGLEGGRMNIVPVDFVVDAMDHIAHKKGLDGKCFHLTDPDPYRFGEVINIFAGAAHAPLASMRVNARMFDAVPSMVWQGLAMIAPVQRIINQILKDLGIPKDLFQFINYPTRFDTRETEKALKESGIACPRLPSYAPAIWDYWERNLDPDLFVDRSLAGKVRDKVVVVTGGSSGIGLATAIKLGEAGAKVIIAARDPEKLAEAAKQIKAVGGNVFTHSVDLSDLDALDRFAAQILKEHGSVDYLINNAGRSIRRAIANSYDRFHDFQRTMQLNYFGAIRLIMALLPSMTARHHGHIINISSIGVLSNAPRFSAYVASKAALDAFSRCASSEFADNGINFTTINMPLVRTPMIAPTKMYDHVPAISPEEAADMVVRAIVYRPTRIATRLGIFAAVLHALMPKATQVILNTSFRLFPDSSAAKGKKEEAPELTPEQVAFAQLTRGIHW